MLDKEEIYTYLAKYFIANYNTNNKRCVFTIIDSDISIDVSKISEELEGDYFFTKHIKPYIYNYMKDIYEERFSGMSINAQSLQSIINILVSHFRIHKVEDVENIIKRIKRSITLDNI